MSDSSLFAPNYQATPQQPLSSGFIAASTDADVIRGLETVSEQLTGTTYPY